MKRIVGVQIGPDRRKLIDRYLNEDFKYELYQYKSAYSKSEKQQVDKGSFFRSFYLDDLYEAKAYKWMLQNIDKNQKILFWCVGRRLAGDEVESICSR